MTYTVHVKRTAEKELLSLPDYVRSRVVEILFSLEENPHPHGVKKLQGAKEFRLRVGDYRIVYQINTHEKKIEIIAIAHRKDVYR